MSDDFSSGCKSDSEMDERFYISLPVECKEWCVMGVVCNGSVVLNTDKL